MSVYAREISCVSKHVNADRLSCGFVDNEKVIFETGEFYNGDVVAYIPEGNLVPVARTEFSWLKANTYHKVRPRKIRGIRSMGVVVPVRGARPGDDVTERLGVIPVVYEMGTPWFHVFAVIFMVGVALWLMFS